ncbi:MAG: alcohol dehydrogenase catalytic domain-containing protein [Nitrososphaerota archaeon]
MKAAFISSSGGKVELRDVEVPKISEGEILVRMRACGICGTDLEKVYGKPVTKPTIGHEVVGTVEESNTDRFSKGDRVFAHHHVSCNKCYYCLNDSPTMCSLFSETNIDPCGFAEFFRVPAVNVEMGAVLNLPDNVSDEEGTFIEPAACVLRCLERCRFRHGMSAAVIGLGPAGAIFVKILRELGASFIVAADVVPFRVKFAEKIGADISINTATERLDDVCRKATEGRGVDIAVVATSSSKAIPVALEAVRKGGTLCLFGAPEKGAIVGLDISNIFIREISLVTSYSTTEKYTNLSLSLIASGRIGYSDLITHRFRLENVDEAFKTAIDASNAMKVIVRP